MSYLRNRYAGKQKLPLLYKVLSKGINNVWSCRVGIRLQKFTWQLITSGKHPWEGPVIIRLQLVFGCFRGTHFRSLTTSAKGPEKVCLSLMFSLRPFRSMVDCRPTKEPEKARDSAHYEHESIRSERCDTWTIKERSFQDPHFCVRKPNFFFLLLCSVSPFLLSLSLHLSPPTAPVVAVVVGPVPVPLSPCHCLLRLSPCITLFLHHNSTHPPLHGRIYI